MTIEDILNSEEFQEIENNSIEYKNHKIEKVGLCFQVRQMKTNFLRFETNSTGNIEECKKHIDCIENFKNV